MNIRIIKNASSIYEAYEVKDCNCKQEAPLLADVNKDNLLERLKELFKSSGGGKNPVHFKIIE